MFPRLVTTLMAMAAVALASSPPSATAKPLNVKVRVSGPTVARSIGSSGGTLTLRSPQGRFRLVIPKRALAKRTRIRMRAATPGKGWPLGRTAAVQLTPEGLQLFRPARLTLVPRRPMPLAKRAPVAWSGSGRDVHVFPPVLGTKAMVLSISHFSGYSWALAPTGQWVQVYDRGPLKLLPQMEAAVGEVIAPAARNKTDPNSQAFKDAFAAKLVGMFEYLADRLAVAERGGQWREVVQGAAAFDSLLNLYSGKGLLGFYPPESSDPAVAARLEALRQKVQASFWRVYENAYARARASCRDTRKSVYAGEMHKIAAEMTNLGRPISPDQVSADAVPCTRREPLPTTLVATLTESWDTTITGGTPPYESHQRITIHGTFTVLETNGETAVYELRSGTWEASQSGFDSNYCGYSGSGSGTLFDDGDTWIVLGDSLNVLVTPTGSFPVTYTCQGGAGHTEDGAPRLFDLVLPNQDYGLYTLSGSYQWKDANTPSSESSTIDRSWSVTPGGSTAASVMPLR